jgi:hypothetical protein
MMTKMENVRWMNEAKNKMSMFAGHVGISRK